MMGHFSGGNMPKTTAQPTLGAICVEVPLPDGSLSMFIGHEVAREDGRIVLDQAAWIACTGRRHLFFADTPDSAVEVEPYPDEVRVCLPLTGAILTSWPHPLPRGAR